MNTHPISIDFKPKIEEIRRRYDHCSASHSFNSLYLWQQDMALRVYLEESSFIVQCGHWGDNVWFFPCGSREDVVRLVNLVSNEGEPVRFLYLREEDAALLQDAFPGRFQIRPAPDSSEYLFDRFDYVNVPGKKGESIRYAINHLKKNHVLSVSPFSSENIETAGKILRGWTPHTTSSHYSTDVATADLLTAHYDALGLTGIIVSMDQVASAVVVGFPLNEYMFDIAFSKGTDRITGLLHFARRAFVDSLPEQFTVINGEEDLGIPGLRQAKLLEHPMGMLEMYEAYG